MAGLSHFFKNIGKRADKAIHEAQKNPSHFPGGVEAEINRRAGKPVTPPAASAYSRPSGYQRFFKGK